MRCKQCGGPFHPSSGHFHAPDFPICGACIRPFIAFYKGRMAYRKKGASFADAAATSIHAPPTSSRRARRLIPDNQIENDVKVADVIGDAALAPEADEVIALG